MNSWQGILPRLECTYLRDLYSPLFLSLNRFGYLYSFFKRLKALRFELELMNTSSRMLLKLQLLVYLG